MGLSRPAVALTPGEFTAEVHAVPAQIQEQSQSVSLRSGSGPVYHL